MVRVGLALLPRAKLVMYPNVPPPNGYVGIADELRVVEQIERFDPKQELAFTPRLEARE